MENQSKYLVNKRGNPPGTIIYKGNKKESSVKINFIEYNNTSYAEKELDNFDNLSILPDDKITWININGLNQTEVIEQLGNKYNFHSLILEDIVNTEHPSKIEYYDDFLFVILKSASFHPKTRLIKFEHISIILGKNYVISCAELDDSFFQPVKDRIKNNGRITKYGADYLFYCLMDLVMDDYIQVMDSIGLEIDNLEYDLITKTRNETLNIIHDFKRNNIHLRKNFKSLREIIRRLDIEDTKLIDENTHIYVKDLYDHAVMVNDSLDELRETLSVMLDIYLTSSGNKLNEIMKVLTLIATIFIPLTFIAGVYGMNFKFMPELEWKWGYPLLWLIMIGVGVVMLVFFKRKKWF